MSSVINAAMQFRYIVVTAVLIVFASGIGNTSRSTLDLLPEFVPPIVEVQTEALGLSAEEVESLITVPMEADLLNGISWIKTIRSQSLAGLSSIVMEFEEGTDIWKARQLVQERLTQAHALPNVSRPPVMLQPLASASRIMQVGLTSSELSNIEISVEAHWNIRPRLMGVPGVANVAIWGMKNQQLQVLVDPANLRANGVTLRQVLATAGNSLWFSPLSYLDASAPGSGGFVDTPNQRLSIRHVLPISSPEDFAKVAIEGSTLTLGDVAEIVEDHQPIIGDALVDQKSGLMLVVEKFPWANTVDVTMGVEEALDVLRPSLPGIEIDTDIRRSADYVEQAGQNIGAATAIAAAVFLAVLAVFTRNVAAVIVGAASIATTYFGAQLLFALLPMKPNVLMIAGMLAASGIAATDAIYMSGSAARGNTTSFTDRIAQSANGLGRVLVIAMLFAFAAALPMFAFGGVSGAVAASVAAAFALTVVLSGLVALVVAPAVAQIVAQLAPGAAPTAPTSDAPRHAPFKTRHAAVYFTGLAVVAALVLVSVARTPLSLPPKFRENVIEVLWAAAPGTSSTETFRMANSLLNELGSVEGVTNVSGQIGRAITSDTTANVNSAQLWVALDPAADRDAAVTEITSIVDGYPGAKREVASYLETVARPYRQNRQVDELRVRVFGQEYAQLDTIVADLRDQLDGVAGDRSVAIQPETYEPVLNIQADLKKSMPYGIRPGDVRRTSAILLSGLEVGSLFEDQKVFEVVLWGTPELRSSVSAVSDILIDTPKGGVVRLGDVADVSVGSVPSVIRRDAVSRYRDIIVDVRGADIDSVAAEIETRLAANAFPLEYHAELLDDHIVAKTAKNQLLLALAAAAVVLFLLIQSVVAGWRLSGAIFVSLVAGLSGAAVAILLTGNVLTIGAVAGLLGTLAFGGRMALAQVASYHDLEISTGGFEPEALMRLWSRQFGPGVLAAVGAVAILLPFAVMGAERPGLETIADLSIVLIGGLITTTLINLYLLPALYLQLGAGTATRESNLFDIGGEQNVPAE